MRRQNTHWSHSEVAERIAGMIRAWSLAVEIARIRSPNLALLCALGREVEPEKNSGGFRRCAIGIQSNADGSVKPIGCYWPLVPARIGLLLLKQFELEPLALYREFLEIHPFADGNGRVGKILLNWRNGTLLENPIFPPNDFWGEPIVNP